ncbi:PPAP2A [Cordylochernes scorpioides]|uniref:PPAP2A n=1 Tax=Cordylochernes scorpioides TaxID=51811 RepID=A0ABY6K5E3_9ARAC|nr:PPAP2A [Cordylochernes scorpioides]
MTRTIIPKPGTGKGLATFNLEVEEKKTVSPKAYLTNVKISSKEIVKAKIDRYWNQPLSIERIEPDMEDKSSWEIWSDKNDEAFGIIITTLTNEQAGMFIGETNAKKDLGILESELGKGSGLVVELVFSLKMVILTPTMDLWLAHIHAGVWLGTGGVESSTIGQWLDYREGASESISDLVGPGHPPQSGGLITGRVSESILDSGLLLSRPKVASGSSLHLKITKAGVLYFVFTIVYNPLSQHDWCGTVGIPILHYYVAGQPYKRGFYCSDSSIHYPLRDSTVSDALLNRVGYFLPLFTVSSISFLINRYMATFLST